MKVNVDAHLPENMRNQTGKDRKWKLKVIQLYIGHIFTGVGVGVGSS